MVEIVKSGYDENPEFVGETYEAECSDVDDDLWETAINTVYASDLGNWLTTAKASCVSLNPLYENGYFDDLENLTRPNCLTDQVNHL